MKRTRPLLFLKLFLSCPPHHQQLSEGFIEASAINFSSYQVPIKIMLQKREREKQEVSIRGCLGLSFPCLARRRRRRFLRLGFFTANASSSAASSSPLPHLLLPHHLRHVRPRDRLPERRRGDQKVQELEGVRVRQEPHKLGPPKVVEVFQVVEEAGVVEVALLGQVGEVLRVREELEELEVLFRWCFGGVLGGIFGTAAGGK